MPPLGLGLGLGITHTLGGGGGVPFTVETGLIDYGDSYGDTLRSRSMVLGDNGKLYSAPYRVNELFEIDPADDSVTFHDTSGIDIQAKRWLDGLQHPTNGKAYFGHVGALDMLTVDTSGPSITLSNVPTGGVADFRGVAHSPITDYIYLPRFNGTTSFGQINAATDSLTGGSATWPLIQTGEVWTVNGTPSAAQTTALTRQWGLTYAPNSKKVYGTPFGGDRVAIYDTNTSNGSMSVNTVDGGLPLPTNNSETGSAYFSKYSGKGIYLDRSAESTNVGHWIYIMPREGNTILKIDTDNDFCYEIPIPQILQDETKDRSMSAVLGPDGFIYSTPWAMPYIFRINPANDSISYFYVGDLMIADNGYDNDINGGNGWWTYGEAAGDWIYYACGGAKKFLKIRVIESPASTLTYAGQDLTYAGQTLTYN